MNSKMDTIEIINYIKNSKKSTFSKAYVYGDFEIDRKVGLKVFGCEKFKILIGELEPILNIIDFYKDKIEDYHLEIDRRNSKVPLLDYSKINARIEPGVIIREHVNIGDNAVIMMGAVINIGASIGKDTMIDMNTVIGGRAEIGSRCHIGAGTVVAGVIEPASATPVIIEDDVLIGANAVILEGIRIGKGAIIGAGSIVTKDVPSNAVVAGNPARYLRDKDEELSKKSEIIDDLRR